MEFLDAKEQVIDLELTSYGRFMLSQGKFKPKVYAFFDNDILYDNRFAQSGSAVKTKELQNSVEGRIQEGTPRLAAQLSTEVPSLEYFLQSRIWFTI